MPVACFVSRHNRVDNGGGDGFHNQNGADNGGNQPKIMIITDFSTTASGGASWHEECTNESITKALNLHIQLNKIAKKGTVYKSPAKASLCKLLKLIKGHQPSCGGSLACLKLHKALDAWGLL